MEQPRQRFVMLLAGFVFLYFMATIRNVLGARNSPARGSEELARVASGVRHGDWTWRRLPSTNGADVDPVVSKSVATASAGLF